MEDIPGDGASACYGDMGPRHGGTPWRSFLGTVPVLALGIWDLPGVGHGISPWWDTMESIPGDSASACCGDMGSPWGGTRDLAMVGHPGEHPWEQCQCLLWGHETSLWWDTIEGIRGDGASACYGDMGPPCGGTPWRASLGTVAVLAVGIWDLPGVGRGTSPGWDTGPPQGGTRDLAMVGHCGEHL